MSKRSYFEEYDYDVVAECSGPHLFNKICSKCKYFACPNCVANELPPGSSCEVPECMTTNCGLCNNVFKTKKGHACSGGASSAAAVPLLAPFAALDAVAYAAAASSRASLAAPAAAASTAAAAASAAPSAAEAKTAEDGIKAFGLFTLQTYSKLRVSGMPFSSDFANSLIHSYFSQFCFFIKKFNNTKLYRDTEAFFKANENAESIKKVGLQATLRKCFHLHKEPFVINLIVTLM